MKLKNIFIHAGVVLSASVFTLLSGMTFAEHNKGGVSPTDKRWVASWASAQKTPTAVFDAPTPAFNDTTLRQIVRVSIGGRAVRVWLSNELGSADLNIGDAYVARRAEGSMIQEGSSRRLRFGGETSVTIPAGARVLSDPVKLWVPSLSDLAISIHLPDDFSESGSPPTYHVRALQTSYLADGNQAGESDLLNSTTTTSWFFLSAVDVLARRPVPVIAATGDSITDGDQASDNEPVDLNHRFTDFLAQSLLQRGKRGVADDAAVINLGISGNQVTSTLIGESAGARLNRDVLTQTGVTHVLVTEGINDIGLPVLLNAFGLAGIFGPDPRPEISAEQIIAGHQQLIARIHAAGLKAIGGTLSPSGGSALPGYSGDVMESKRQAVNTWIREESGYDIVVDFDAVLRDPDDPTISREDLTADGLHPNSEGYAAMAKAVNRALFPHKKKGRKRR